MRAELTFEREPAQLVRSIARCTKDILPVSKKKVNNPMPKVTKSDCLHERGRGPTKRGAQSYTESPLLLSEQLVQLLLKCSFLCIWKRIELPKIVLDVLRILVKAENIGQCDMVDDFWRRKSIDLLLKDMVQVFFRVGELLLHMLALVQALHDFRDI